VPILSYKLLPWERETGKECLTSDGNWSLKIRNTVITTVACQVGFSNGSGTHRSTFCIFFIHFSLSSDVIISVERTEDHPGMLVSNNRALLLSCVSCLTIPKTANFSRQNGKEHCIGRYNWEKCERKKSNQVWHYFEFSGVDAWLAEQRHTETGHPPSIFNRPVHLFTRRSFPLLETTCLGNDERITNKLPWR
jgi:hypothetical protein